MLDAEQRLRRLERALAAGDAGAADAYADALDRYAALGGYELEGRIERTLGELQLPPSVVDRPLRELSGGQRMRVGLAAVLASSFPLYVLDEPTNDLGLPALERLERFVATSPATFLITAHDRAFLAATATEVVELDEHTHTATA